MASGRRLPRVEGNEFLAIAAQKFFNSRENQVKNPLFLAGRNLTSKTLNSLTFWLKTRIASHYPANRERQRIPKITTKYSFSVYRFRFNFDNEKSLWGAAGRQLRIGIWDLDFVIWDLEIV